MRIVVSTVGAPTYKVEDYFITIIQSILNNNETRIVNSRKSVDLADTRYKSNTAEATNIIINILGKNLSGVRMNIHQLDNPVPI